MTLMQSLSNTVKQSMHLFYASLMQGEFPECLEVAEVISIHKKGDKNKATKYRTISLLSQFDKIFEKLIYNRLISYLGKYNLLSEKQFGFRKNYSADMAISNIYDHLIQNIDQNLYSCCIFFDLFKVFDTVDHKILLNKMKSNFGIISIALNLFASYLSNRQQYTKIRNETRIYMKLLVESHKVLA